MSKGFQCEFVSYVNRDADLKNNKVMESTNQKQKSPRLLKGFTRKVDLKRKPIKRSQETTSKTLMKKNTNNKPPSLIASRPKRTVIPKNYLEEATGLSWQEENELKKALYASLQESKCQSPQIFGDSEAKTDLVNEESHSKKKHKSLLRSNIPSVLNKLKLSSCSISKDKPKSPIKKKSYSLPTKYKKKKEIIKQEKLPTVKKKDTSLENSSSICEDLEISAFKPKMHAQRKFAQNQSSFTPSPSVTPSATPIKFLKTSPKEKKKDLNTGKKAKTEDFLTFLCLRGTSALPPRLEFFNYADTQSTSSNSRPQTPQSKTSLWKEKKTSPAKTNTRFEKELGVKPLSKKTPEKLSRYRENSLPRSRSPSPPPQLSPVPPPGVKRIKTKLPPCLAPVLPLKKVRLSKFVNLSEKAERKQQANIIKARQLTKKAKQQRKTVKDVKKHVKVGRKRKMHSDDESPGKKLKKADKSEFEEINDVDTTGTEKRARLKRKSKIYLESDWKLDSDLSSDFEEASQKMVKKRKLIKSKIKTTARIMKGIKNLRPRLKKLDDTVYAFEDDEISFKVDEKSLPKVKATKKTYKLGKALLKKCDDKGVSEQSLLLKRKKPKSDKVKELLCSDKSSKHLQQEHVTQTQTKKSHIKEIPVLYPTLEEFQDPMKFIASVKDEVEPFGMCKVVPPDGWKPECKILEEMRFSGQVQYIDRMMDRWGPNAVKMESIRKHLESQEIKLDHPPLIAGIELDLPRCHDIIQGFGGMQKVIDKKKWGKVIDALGIPATAHDWSAKLYSAYCKYLLSYAALSEDEQKKLEQQVLEETSKNEHESAECVRKGRSMSLSNFFRVAETTRSMWFKDEPTPEQVKEQYCKLISDKTQHVAVQCSHLDTITCGSGFPTKGPYSKHGWNFNVLSQNKDCILHHLGHIKGVSSPTLHLGMLFSTSCWSCDPHLLPYVHYLHTGSDIIWNSVRKDDLFWFQSAMQQIVPSELSDKPIWLLEDTAMVPVEMLASKGVTVSEVVQKEGEFVIVFPETYTATLSCGYNVSESLHVADSDWIPLGCKAAKNLQTSSVAELFSMEQLLLLLAKNEETTIQTLQTSVPLLESMIFYELELRKQLMDAGLKTIEKLSVEDEISHTQNTRRRKLAMVVEEEGNVCEISKKICYFSMVVHEIEDGEDVVYSLEQALLTIPKKNLRSCKLICRYDQKELKSTLDRVKVKMGLLEAARKRNAKK